MAGKIQRQKLAKGGHRGRHGLLGLAAPRATSRAVARKSIDRNRGADYAKFERLRADVEALEKEEASGWAGTKNAAEAKAKAKELKNLRAKLTLKERKHGGGGGVGKK